MGIDYDRSVKKLLLGVTLCIAVATAMVRTSFFYGIDYSKSVATFFQNVSPFIFDHWIGTVWDGDSHNRTIFCGTNLCLCCSCQCFYHSWRRNLFPIFIINAEENVKKGMKIKEITKKYEGKKVVDHVSFEIPKGKVIS